MTPSDRVQVHIKYKDSEQDFEGNADETWLLLRNFFGYLIPTFEVAQKLWLNVDLQQLANDCEGLISFSPEGANLLVPKKKLTDNETLLMWLLARYLGFRLGLLATEELSKEDLQNKLGKSSKITSTRLGELLKIEWTTKTADDKYKLTSFGVTQMQNDALPRIIAKTGI